MKSITIESKGMARGTVITNADGSPLHGVRSVRVDLDIRDEPNLATVEIVTPTLNVVAERWKAVMRHPITNKLSEVRSIQFVDAPTFHCAAESEEQRNDEA